VWKRTTGLVSQYTENTNNAQNLNAGPPVIIEFYNEDFNFANVIFAGTTFTFIDGGMHRLKFQCLVGGTGAKTAISFFLNGNYLYGGVTPQATDGSTFYQIEGLFSIEYIANINPADVLTVVGQQISGGPSFLQRNTVYNAPITTLSIEKLF
jgi:hypothetical protein